MQVPEGHRLVLYRLDPRSLIVSTDAVAWLAHLGTSSDDAEQELDAVLAGVGALMQGGRPRILLSSGGGRLSSLMAPNDPQILPQPHGMLVWTVDAAGLAGAPRGSTLVQRWLRCLYVTGTRSAPPAQCVFLRETASPQARAVAALVRGLGFAVHVPEDNGAIVAEVHRPDGVILTVLLGGLQRTAEPADDHALQMNKAKDRAENDGDAGQLQRLEADERDALEVKLASAAGAPRVAPVRRAPRLHRLVLAAADHGDAACPALYEELLRREVPLQVIIDPKTRGARLQTWPGGIEALPVYADEAALLKSARDLGMPLGSFAGAVMPPPELFGWAAGHSWAIAMNAFRTPDQPVYVVLTAETVKALAGGRMPTVLAS